jgi:peptidoglycan lytic transglycosylase G
VRILAVLALLLAAAAIWFVVSLFQPFKGDASTKRSTVLIPGGVDAGKIGDILERRGVVSSSFFFDLRARLSGDRDNLKPGVYRLPHDSSYADVLNRLTKGPPTIKKVAITVPEGRSRREEAARIRANSNLEGSYLAATKRSRLLRPARYGAPRGTPSLEGFLFPATYELKSDAPVNQLVGEQLRAFKRAIRRVNMRAARRRNFTTYDVLTVASMVEREAMLRRERPIIAGVIYNRLRRNIPLGIDATIRYATGNWLRPLTQSQLRINSAYNTRTHQGLPPTPIGSPGIASIRAAAHPKRTPYLYYVVKPGGCGEHAFTTSFAAFQRASAHYEAARAKKGGSPTKCPK